MNESLEHILELESVNTGLIHLFLLPSKDGWAAYEQSAPNLETLVPEVKATSTEIVFPEAEIKLRRVLLNPEQMFRYPLPLLCTQTGDEYLRLSLQGLPFNPVE